MSPGREPAESQLSLARYRLRVTKRGNARFLSHLDTVRTLLRALRRAGVPVALSGGFHPQPKVAYATALAVGVESEAEYVDVETRQQIEPIAIARALAAELPAGFGLAEVRTVPLGRPALASYNAIARYEATPGDAGAIVSSQGEQPHGDADAIARRAEELLAAPTLVVTRQPRKQIDIRPHIVSVVVAAGPRIELELLSEQTGAARVAEVMTLLGLDPAAWRVRKTDFWPLARGSRVSPWQA